MKWFGVVAAVVAFWFGAAGPGTGQAVAAPADAKSARSKQAVAPRKSVSRANRAHRPANKERARSRVAGSGSKRAKSKPVAAAAAAATRPAVAATSAVVPASLQATAPDAAATMSIGEAIGLHTIPDRLALRSAVALLVDANTGEVLYDKNSRAVLPIASITKLMTAMVVLDARQSLDEPITILDADRDTERFSASRLPVGSRLTRRELLHLALMSSENRAASALARNYPGGDSAFVAAANRKAADIGMRDSIFMDGTGLSAGNVSTARDLAVLVAHAARYPLIARFSTDDRLTVRTAQGSRAFGTTNRLVRNPSWDISLQKTGYINESGNCLVMRGQIDGRNLIMVLLDSHGRYSRLGDAQRLRRWLEG